MASGKPEDQQAPRLHIVRVVVSVCACIALLGGAAGASYLIFRSQPTAQSEGATRKSAALVETIQAERGDHRPRLEVLGVVEPAREVMLSPRVAGQVVELDPAFVPGGIVEAGQRLIGLDPEDFEQMLLMRQSERQQVEAELAIEEGRQRAAEQEFALLGEEIDPENRALVLREPQIASIRARLDAAIAAERQARLELERTSITAPFAAQILSRTADVGSQVAPGGVLGRLVGVDEYWIIASVPLRDLRWISFPEDDGEAAPVEVRYAAAWEPGVSRKAAVSRLIGAIDQQSRLARVLITLPDPLGRQSDAPPLIIGTIVQLGIEGKLLRDVVKIDRDYIRQNDTVWLYVDGVLEIRPVDVVFRDAEHAYLRSGIEPGEQIVTTSLATVTNGLALRRAEPATASLPDALPGASQ